MLEMLAVEECTHTDDFGSTFFMGGPCILCGGADTDQLVVSRAWLAKLVQDQPGLMLAAFLALPEVS